METNSLPRRRNIFITNHRNAIRVKAIHYRDLRIAKLWVFSEWWMVVVDEGKGKANRNRILELLLF